MKEKVRERADFRAHGIPSMEDDNSFSTVSKLFNSFSMMVSCKLLYSIGEGGEGKSRLVGPVF